MRARSLLSATLVLATACTGGELSPAAFVEELDSACRAAADAISSPPVAASSDPAILRMQSLEHALAANRRALERLQAVTARAPASEAEDAAALVAAARRAIEALDDAASAARARASAPLEEAGAEIEDAQRDFREAAERLGADACAASTTAP